MRDARRGGGGAEGVGGVRFASEVVPTPYPVKSSVFRWRPVLSRFSRRVQYEKMEGCEQSNVVSCDRYQPRILRAGICYATLFSVFM